MQVGNKTVDKELRFHRFCMLVGDSKEGKDLKRLFANHLGVPKNLNMENPKDIVEETRINSLDKFVIESWMNP